LRSHRPVAIIRVMRITTFGERRVSPARAVQIQRELADKISRVSCVREPRFIAGADISVRVARGEARAAVVVLKYPELDLVESRVIAGRVDFPYIPGLLSFREAPLILDACEQLSVEPDILLVDGQGLLHPRRFGLACHLGLLLDMPAIGCAKSRLCGGHDTPPDEPGGYAEVIDNGETIGAALRTKAGVKPVYVSIGNYISLKDAIGWVLKCCRGYRLPEPTRLAHLAAGGNLPSKTSRQGRKIAESRCRN